MRQTLVVLWALAGCNQVLGLKDTALTDGGDADALPPGCSVSPRFELEYDSYLVDETPRGHNDALLVTADHPAILRFAAAPNGMRVTAAVLHLSRVERADECGGACAPCPTSTASRYQVYWGRHSWSERRRDRDDPPGRLDQHGPALGRPLRDRRR